jgi:hypothetical protein
LLERAGLTDGGALLLSLHHDSVQSQFLTMKKGRPCSDKAEGFSIFDTVISQNHCSARGFSGGRCERRD